MINAGILNESDESDYEVDIDDDLPRSCQICNNSFSNPVATICLHYFCEKCALDHYGKTSNCYECKKSTNGIFNNANYIIKKIEKLKIKDMKKSKKKNIHKCNGHHSHLKQSEEVINNNDLENEEETPENDTRIDHNLSYYEDEKNEEDNDQKEFEKYSKNKKKKNNFKIQNGWIPPSDYKSYD